jgi:hypothetical protein
MEVPGWSGTTSCHNGICLTALLFDQSTGNKKDRVNRKNNTGTEVNLVVKRVFWEGACSKAGSGQ